MPARTSATERSPPVRIFASVGVERAVDDAMLGVRLKVYGVCLTCQTCAVECPPRGKAKKDLDDEGTIKFGLTNLVLVIHYYIAAWGRVCWRICKRVCYASARRFSFDSAVVYVLGYFDFASPIDRSSNLSNAL